ncbi:MAG: lactate utilization protein C [Thermoflexales bacterium]
MNLPHHNARAREEILSRLRRASPPFPSTTADSKPSLMVTRASPDEDWVQRFITEAERARAVVHRVSNDEEGRVVLRELLTRLGARRAVTWDMAHIPLAGVDAVLEELGIERVQGDNVTVATADVGITGVDWALATTGTLVLHAGPGKPRMASLLPPYHLAILRAGRILPRLEDYFALQRAADLRPLRESSNVTLITGSSATSDIEQQPVRGAHGPLELHIVLLTP